MGALTATVIALTLGVNPQLSEGRALFQRLRYEAAEAKLREAQRNPESTPQERAEVLDLLARSLAAQGRMDECEEAYRELLVHEPHAPTPGAAPKIRGAFERAKRRVYPSDYVQLQLRSASGGQVAVELIDPWARVSELVLVDRTGVAAERALARTGASASFEVLFPWTLAARDARGQVVTSLEGPGPEPAVARQESPAPLDAPKPPALEPAPPPSPPPAAVAKVDAQAAPRTPWARWALGTTSVAAAGAGAVLAIFSAESSAAAERARFASDTYALDARAHDQALASNLLFAGALVAAGAAVVVSF